MYLDNNMETIYEYTDSEAIEDGVLAAIKVRYEHPQRGGMTIDRCTAAILAKYGDNMEAIHAIAQLVAAVGKHDGEPPMFTYTVRGVDLWLMQNERGNYTLMFPSDY